MVKDLSLTAKGADLHGPIKAKMCLPGKQILVQCCEIKFSLTEKGCSAAADDTASLGVDSESLGCAVSADWIDFLQY